MVVHPPDIYSEFVAWKQRLHPEFVFVKRSYLRRQQAYNFFLANLDPAPVTTSAVASIPDPEHQLSPNPTYSPFLGPKQHYYINKRGFSEHWDDDERNAKRYKRDYTRPNSETTDITEDTVNNEQDVSLVRVCTGKNYQTFNILY